MTINPKRMKTAMGFAKIRDLLRSIDRIAHRSLYYSSVELSYFLGVV